MRRAVQVQAVDWAIRLNDGDLPPDQSRALSRWLGESPDHGAALEEARVLLGDADAALASDPGFAKRLLRRPRQGATVLSFVLALALVGGVFLWSDGPTWLRADIVTSVNEVSVVALPDGSRLQLGGRSAIATDFNPRERRVTLLRGEAYFEVAADLGGRSFIVEAGGVSITVHGTAFGVNLLEDGTEVAVTEHEISVAPIGATGPALRLTQGEAVSYDRSSGMGAVRPLPPDTAAAWRQGRLVFDGQRLASVAEQMFRYLPGRVVVPDHALADRRISGSFDLADPEAALASFATAFGLRVTRIGGLLTIIHR